MSDIYEADLLHRLQNSRDLQAHKEAILLLMGCVETLEEKVAELEAKTKQSTAYPDVLGDPARRNIMDHISVPDGFKPRRGRPRKVE